MSIFAKAKRAKENKKGFTLVELIVVLVILAILAAILVPALTGWIDKAKGQQYLLDARAFLMATEALAVEQYADGNPFHESTVYFTSDDLPGYGNWGVISSYADDVGYPFVAKAIFGSISDTEKLRIEEFTFEVKEGNSDGTILYTITFTLKDGVGSWTVEKAS